MNSTKNAIGPINSSKSKLNSKKSWIFKPMLIATYI